MNNGRWSGIYTDSLKPLKRERILHCVITELCHCSNPKGLSYPGVQYIGTEWGYAPESVENALQKLSEMDFIRCHLTNDGLGSGQRLVYQVNPAFLYVREALVDECLALWNKGKSYNVIRSEMKHIQPDMDPETETDEYPKTETDEYPSEQPQRTSLEERGKNTSVSSTRQNERSNRPPRNMQLTNTNNGKAVNQAIAIQHFETFANGETHGKAENKKQNPPPLRQPPPFNFPLDDWQDEELAKELASLGNGTKRERAREIVWQYNNRALIRKAIEMSASAKKSRIGYIIRALEKGWVKCDPLDDDPRAYLIDHTGQFLDPKYETPENIAWRDSLEWSTK